ncbi:MAG: hypothetical protein ACPGO3_01900 [Magnetospiraceae bacterium]
MAPLKPNSRLSVFELVSSTVAEAGMRWKVLLQAALTPMAAGTLLVWLCNTLGLPKLGTVISILLVLAFYRVVHRLVLAEIPPPLPLGISLGAHELHFYMHFLAAAFLPMVVVVPVYIGLALLIGSTPDAVWLPMTLAGLLALYLGTRLTLVLPMVAMGHGSKLTERLFMAWRLSRGNGMTLVLATLLMALLAIFMVLLPTALVKGIAVVLGAPILLDAVHVLGDFVTGSLSSIFVSLAYQRLSSGVLVPTQSDDDDAI